ncbi:MAG: flagellar export chaperone FliS [Candidatus Nitronauta litoralis]|uniref:Flagellar export chaperone FliS n=1 Tax=Candidatus Nitronauta litoralis TaxID=2705533 RepID=A0A7T0BY47_9BACT|nr:MAG: flagellar export chaperone FliS [Candidatus Nitronauta litoralis]
MGPSNFHKEYQKNAVATSNQGKLILMMYDGAIKFTRMALDSMDRNDLAGKGNNIRKTQDIINELSLALNMDKGGEISVKLESLYRYTINQLTLANVKADRDALQTVLKILVPLREAWNQIFTSPPEKETSGPPETSPNATAPPSSIMPSSNSNGAETPPPPRKTSFTFRA